LIIKWLENAIDFRPARRLNALIINQLRGCSDRLYRREKLENGPGTPYLCISNRTAARQGVLPGSTLKSKEYGNEEK
jgi:hypothetical protein